MAGKFIVADGASFVNSGIVYKPGDSISPGIFNSLDNFNAQVAAGRIICIEKDPEPVKEPEKEPEAKPAAKKAPVKAKAPAKGKKK
ncbi:MAG: hypothetical protein IKT97_07725 [Spirochaetia bacterium]|nr:hypothetical protein [Spirochaetia bacterium]